ncbi:sphingosine kinase 1-like [Ananas comosus]|uniref:sphingosine kinase n=1 Tax=Ananas comosus TaxID=4615 RepID=A0A6P5FHY0_ANACO|nr:sphingosine kinase 1-like [Ananas comosus]
MATAKEETATFTLNLTENVRFNGAPAELTLGADGALRWRGVGVGVGGGGERRVGLEEEVLGIEVEGSRLIRIRAFVGESEGVACGKGERVGKRARRDYVFEMPTDEAAMRWNDKLTDHINSLGRPKHLFIIVNPFGGKKCGSKIFQAEVKSLLDAAGILYTVKETMHQLHAQEIAYSLDISKYDGIVCVSGDGVLAEVVNGLLHREDWETAIKMPLGVIPAGTGNGMAKSLLHSAGELYSVSNAVFAIIRGHKRSLDVATITQGETKFFSVLLLTWGLVADIDIESEKYRWMGSARLEFYALVRIMNLRKYSGRVQFVPAPGYEECGEPLKKVDVRKSDDNLSQEGQRNNAKPYCRSYHGPSVEFEDSEWRSLDGPFISAWVNNVPWCAEDFMSAPEAKFSDGYLDVIIVRDCPKSALLSMMLKMSDGSYIKSPYVMYLKVKAFRLEPGQRMEDPTNGGVIDSDGEVIARGDKSHHRNQQKYLMAYGPPIEMTIDKGLATIFSPC